MIETEELLPIGQYLERARQFYGTPPVHLLPTLLWLSASNAMLNALCWAGIGLSVLAVASITPVLTFSLLWITYLSLTVAGQTFLSFQWDTLLLDTGLLACLYPPLGWRRELQSDLTEPMSLP